MKKKAKDLVAGDRIVVTVTDASRGDGMSRSQYFEIENEGHNHTIGDANCDHRQMPPFCEKELGYPLLCPCGGLIHATWSEQADNVLLTECDKCGTKLDEKAGA